MLFKNTYLSKEIYQTQKKMYVKGRWEQQSGNESGSRGKGVK